MHYIARIPIAVACALGMGTALAQTVQRGDVTVGTAGEATQTVAQASTAAPIQTAQTGAGGAAGGASAGGAAAGAGLGTTLVVVGAAVAAIAVATDDGGTTTTHH